MAKLRERDWRSLLDAVQRLNEPDTPAALAATMLEVVNSLIPCEHSSYDEVDLLRKQTLGLCSDPAVDEAWPNLESAVAAHFHEHPVLHFFKDHPAAGPRRISDFLDLSDFRETGLYRDCYRHLGVDHQLVLRLPSRPGTEVGLALNRAGHDFSERDRRCLDLLRPHLHQAYLRAVTAASLREQVAATGLAAATLPHGLIVLDGRRRLVLCNSRAQRQLARHFPHDPILTHLPDPLDRWVDSLGTADPAGAAESSQAIETPAGRLSVVASRHPATGAWALRITEEQAYPAAVETLTALGLTHRQAEVLYWLAQGKTNPEIGMILNVSPRTVQKHVEHVFQVLGVETRTMATVKAMEMLRNAQP